MSRTALALLTTLALLLAPLAPTASAAAAGREHRCTITGTSGDDRLVGTKRDDVICGLGGDDVLYGMGGDDVLLGGPGRDRLLGGPGSDRLRGGPGRDRELGGERGKPGHGKKNRAKPNRERPVMSDLSLSTNAVDVTSGPARVTVRVRGRDVDDGLRTVFVTLPGPPPLQYGRGGWPRHESSLVLVDGDRQDGWWEGEVEFPRHTPAGTHRIAVRGVDGRWDDVSALGLGVEVRNDDTDLDPPEVTLLGPGPDHVVDVRNGASSVTLTARITDAKSGVYEVFFMVRERHPDGGGRGYSFMPRPVSGDRRDGVWQFTFAIPTVAMSSRWMVSVTVKDWAAASRSEYGTTYWGPARNNFTYGLVGEHRYLPGGTGSFGVRGPDVVDIDAPSVMPARLDVARLEDLWGMRTTADVVVPVSDPGGVNWVTGQLAPAGVDPEVAQRRGFGSWGMSLDSGSTQDGTWRVRLDVPGYAPRGSYVLWVMAMDDRGNLTLDDRTTVTIT